MTNRPLTAHEQADARAAYNAIGRLYSAVGHTATLGLANELLYRLIDHNTTDGKPLRTERAPTAADIGRRVRCKDYNGSLTNRTFRFAGFMSDGAFVTESECGAINTWSYCIIDEDAQ